jgi:uncharacterized membrane protein YoaK (UPF0700 family)
MPLRRLTARERSARSNWQLAAILALTAGVVDVSGFLALHQYTSHMSGSVAAIAADIASHGVSVMLQPGIVLVCFLAGAAACALLINWSRRRDRESLFALPVLLEAVLLASLAIFASPHHLLLTLSVLSFSMGLQNAIITKVSQAEIRTTHITGMVTDIGIELGKAIYWNRNSALPPVQAEGRSLLLLSMLVAMFFAGGTVGALAYPHFGFLVMLPFAVALATLTILPITEDFKRANT